MEELLQTIINKLNKIEEQISEIKEELKEIKEYTGKMDKHIDFVDGVYDKVKSPFHYIFNSVDRMRGIGNQETLMIE